MSLNLEQAIGGNFVFTKAGTAIGSTTSQVSTANSVTYTLDGVFQTAKAAVASIPLTTPSGFALATIPAGSKANLGLWLDSAGNYTVTQGPSNVVTSATDKVAPPPNPGSRVLVGVASVYTATNPFIPATTAFTATGVTTTYFDTSLLPAGGF